MIDINEAKSGDCVYVLITIQSAPVYGEIVRVLDKENAIEVFTPHWGNRVVIASNAYWEEKQAKKGKIVKIEHNYKQWAKEYMTDEETETDNRIDTIYHGQSKVSEDQGKDQGNDPVQESPKRKQKVVRKSTKRKRATRRNRKTRSRKE